MTSDVGDQSGGDLLPGLLQLLGSGQGVFGSSQARLFQHQGGEAGIAGNLELVGYRHNVVADRVPVEGRAAGEPRFEGR